MAISDAQRRAVHAKLKDNPYKNAAMSMSRAVSDDGILSRIGEMRGAKKKAGEAPPEPSVAEEMLEHTEDTGLDKEIDKHGTEGMGTKSDVTEQNLDKGGKNALGHHKDSTGASMHKAISHSADESGEEMDETAGADNDDEVPALSHVDRISRSFSSPRAKKRTVEVGSKSDFKSLHARSMDKLRSKT